MREFGDWINDMANSIPDASEVKREKPVPEKGSINESYRAKLQKIVDKLDYLGYTLDNINAFESSWICLPDASKDKLYEYWMAK